MYHFVSKLTNNKTTGTLSATLYMLMPYHLNNMYIRNALGEFLSYMFIPLVFLGIYKLFQKEKGEWILIIGAVGLLITHNLSTMITVIIAFIYFCTNLSKLKDKQILKKSVLNVVLILIISAFFWIPVIQTLTFNHYDVYEENAMATANSFTKAGLDLKDLFFTSKDSTFVFEIGFPILLMIFSSFFVFRNVTKTNIKKEYLLFGCLGILCTLMATTYFPWGFLDNAFKILQFPWRMLVFSNFFFAIICSINVSHLLKKFGIIDVVFFSFLTLAFVLPLSHFIPTNSEMVDIEKQSLGVVTEKKNHTIAAMGKGEYLPTIINHNRTYINSREDNICILKGIGKIENLEKNGQKLTCKIESLEDNSIFEFPYIYYPGYQVTVNGNEIPCFESKNGFLAISLPQSPMSDIVVEYTQTNAMKTSKLISLIGIVLLGCYIFHEKSKISNAI